jgi:hypothetical protein
MSHAPRREQAIVTVFYFVQLRIAVWKSCHYMNALTVNKSHRVLPVIDHKE